MVRCPISSSHTLLEIAPDLFQCPDCGAGPTMYWALSDVELDDGLYGAVCSTWNPEAQGYARAYILWNVDKNGRRRGEVQSHPVDFISDARMLSSATLPVRSATGEPVRLTRGMLKSPYGEKLVRKGGRAGTSAGSPSPEEPEGRSPRRRQKAAP